MQLTDGNKGFYNDVFSVIPYGPLKIFGSDFFGKFCTDKLK